MSALVEMRAFTVRYGSTLALDSIDLDLHAHRVTAVIGPAGAGKSTLLRALNRMNELVAVSSREGTIRLGGVDIHGGDIDPLALRRRVGMTFERPNPFPRSIFDNLAWGLSIHGVDDHVEARIEQALTRVGLWSLLADRLDRPARELSLGDQQRLCIARALVLEPEILLMDEPCSRLDPTSTARIEDLLFDLKTATTIVLVPHSLRQTSRVADDTVLLDAGTLIEAGSTEEMFTRPRRARTEAFVTGRFDV
ncbi:MAG: phosphate ABC transporter ATP-binding protein [Acidobacteriota bacterium]